MKVKILSYHAVAAWRWDMPEDDDCGICRVQFDVSSPVGVTVDIMLTWFQSWDSVLIRFIWFVAMHCLDTWINQESSQGRCPMCRQGTRTRSSLLSFSVVLMETVFRIKGTAEQSEVQPEQTAQS
ncbi:hypothetical protein E4T45_06116 [Aureobasidium sp. EXF-8846]|nr:hypothetical protein E4T45_06116 [Aureobasidium sp. EXF-8846]